MRGSPLAVVLLLIPFATAEQVEFESFTDNPGDVAFEGFLIPDTADPTGFYGNVDLRAGGVWAEDESSITFYLELEELEEASQTPIPFSDPDYYLYFRYGQQGYRVQITSALENPTNDAFGRSGTSSARLQHQLNADFYGSIAEAELDMQFSEDRILVRVSRDFIVDENLAPLAINSTLTDIYATGQSLGWFDIPFFGQGNAAIVTPRFFDIAPDATFGSQYTMKTGSLTRRGDLSALSDDPIRWTNGEATTMRFIATLYNAGDEKEVRVSTAGVDPQWQIAYSDRITAPAGEAINVTFLVSIPFGHAHGSLKTFTARFETEGGSHMATARLGVYWPTIPQPAGHHDTLWLHSRPSDQTPPPPFDALFSGVHSWISAGDESQEELDQGVPIPAFGNTGAIFQGGQGVLNWILNLEPNLRLGMDFDLSRTGSGTFTVNLPYPIVDPVLTANVFYRTIGNNNGRGDFFRVDTLLATGSDIGGSGAVTGKQTFEVELVPTPDADLVPYKPDANIVLWLRLDGMSVAPFFDPTGSLQATLEPGPSSFRLPLFEYSDPVDLSFATDATLQLVPDENGQARKVNPSETVVYTFDMVFDGDATTPFDVVLGGPRADWAQVIGDTSFTLVPGVNRTLAFAVSAPRDAKDGDLADVTLTVTSRLNAAVQAGITTRTTVTTTEDLVDESPRLKSLDADLTTAKDSPVPLWPLLLGLAVIAWSRRRDRSA